MVARARQGAAAPASPPDESARRDFPAPRVHPPLTATAGSPYAYPFTASGNPGPTFTLATGAPTWLALGYRCRRHHGHQRSPVRAAQRSAVRAAGASRSPRLATRPRPSPRLERCPMASGSSITTTTRPTSSSVPAPRLELPDSSYVPSTALRQMRASHSRSRSMLTRQVQTSMHRPALTGSTRRRSVSRPASPESCSWHSSPQTGRPTAGRPHDLPVGPCPGDWSPEPIAHAASSKPRRPAPHQVLLQQVSSGRHATYWLQTTARATAAAGVSVTILDTKPRNDPYNLAAIEIRS